MNSIHPWALVPFALLLAAIAVLPLWARRFWNSNRNKLLVAVLLSLPVAVYLLQAGLGHTLLHTLVFDYIPFIILLGSLCVITGGIFVESTVRGRPFSNTVLMSLGAVLASFIGTTGAAMLLIRPLLHMNRSRAFKTHTFLFFIAIVCNCGGLLTPLGDPPLFMMYLRGAPFGWFFKLWPEWLLCNALLLGIYVMAERRAWRRESPDVRADAGPAVHAVILQGRLNFVWLLGVVLAVAFVNPQTLPVLRTHAWLGSARDALVLLMAVCSLYFTPHLTRVSNGFTWHPVQEVAAIFFGVFVTMVPCLLFLAAHAQQLGLSSPALFYYAAGILSSFLDNTPTAVTFYSLAQGLQLHAGPQIAGIPEALMKAICLGAVLFGAMTYIGNGPNFMVKSIAEHQNIRMPHFFHYIWGFGLAVLLPVFIIVQLVCLGGRSGGP